MTTESGRGSATVRVEITQEQFPSRDVIGELFNSLSLLGEALDIPVTLSIIRTPNNSKQPKSSKDVLAGDSGPPVQENLDLSRSKRILDIRHRILTFCKPYQHTTDEPEYNAIVDDLSKLAQELKRG